MAPNLPFVSVNTTIKVFRQALALDERRAKFRPNFYHQAKPKTTLESSNVKAQDIESGVQAPQGETDEQFTKTHVKEVWFVGCHADVGGGSVLDSNGHALSNISLRWMIKELLDADCGVLFNLSAFGRWNLDVNLVQPQLSTASQSQLTSQGLDQNRGLTNRAKGRENQSQASLSTYELEDLKDLQQKPIDQLEKKPISMWWFLEIIPTTFTFTNPLGETESKRDCHFGRGRWVPPNPLFHKSVEMHRERNGYKPRANYKENSETYVS
ncbi:hypothetical protein B0F90DRAFT_162350 [Multifurca ochricompacta]|uniref:T6SS Phospholipase effector Tle1-like catalytic domain-containing protein n=1 Tax=Multifurca ochricompacta TaxID=376703 RepID=A0AAD4QQU4_9AGAM|nr:hypothetical protein B0F90DRAFT_162350 [Multifurca ochricompacta]